VKKVADMVDGPALCKRSEGWSVHFVSSTIAVQVVCSKPLA